MKRIVALMPFLLILACSNESTQVVKTEKKELGEPDRPHLAGIKRVEIPMDQNDPEARISLAKNFYFIFDGSGSMDDAPDDDCLGDTQFPRKLEGAQFAVTEFLKKVPDDINIGLLIFDNNGSREAVPLGTGNRDAFVAAISSVRAGAGTPLARAIRFGSQRLTTQYKRQLGYGEFRIVVVTDGIAKSIPDAAKHAMSFGFPIYAIGLCVEPNHPLRNYALYYRAADNMADLSKGLEETLAELPVYDAQTFSEQ